MLTLALVLGLMPGMGMTAYAEGTAVDLSTLTDNYTATDGDVLSGTASGKTVTIPAGATVTLNGVNISSGSINCAGDATMILLGSNSVTATDFYAAIKIGGSGTTLTITGSGSLTAQGGLEAAGIGTDRNGSGGNIVINGGTVTATGGDFGAGIGTGRAQGASITCGDITINGGTVTATGGKNGAGIGTGLSVTSSASNTCGAITIGTGVTMVTATKGSSAPNSIGKGTADYGGTQTCGTITIGGTIYWDGSAYQNGGDTYLATSPLIIEHTHTHNDITFTEWTAADSLPTEAGSYYLANNVDLGTTSWDVTNEISLCLNGHSITANNGGSIITIPGGGTLNLYDEEGDLGFIGGNESGARGTGIYIKGGTLNMHGGQITDNIGTGECAGVYVESGAFNLSGGKITGNKGSNVGGVYIVTGSMNILGDPEISGNIKTGSNEKSDLVSIGDGTTFCISGPLTNTTGTPKIGLRSKSGSQVMTTGYNTYHTDTDPGNFFFADDPLKKVSKTDSGEVSLIQAPVKYVEYDKETGEFVEKECTSYEVMDSGNYDAWSSGWYVITEDATITSGFNSGGGGPNNFILLDGVKLTLNGYGFSNGASTNIYGQGGENKPKIVVNNTNNYALILSSYNLTINAVDLELHGLVGGDFQTLTLNGCDAVVNNMTPSWQKTVWGASVELNKSTLNIEAGEEVNLPYVICGDYDNYAPVKVVVNDSDLTVKGGTAAAIRATNGIEVNSGTLTAVGDTQGISNDTPLKMATDRYLYGCDDEGSMEGLAKGTGENITIDETIARKYMKVNGEPFHKHVWTYQADGASITASCDGIGDECTLTEGLTLTINAPTELTYDGNTKAATLSEGYNAEAFPEESTVITYEKDGNTIEAADVKNVGTYKAKVTIGEVEAVLEFVITPVDKTELNTTLSEAERFYDIIKQNFGPIATELKSAIDDAKKVADNDNVLESDVSAATDALNSAIYKALDDVVAVDDAAEDIENLVDIEYITPDNIEDVKAALNTYDQLTDIQKNTIDKNIGRAGTKKIEDIEKALAVVDRIDTLKNTEDIEAGDEKAVSLARTA